MEDDKFRLIRVNSELVCIKPGGDIRKLLIKMSLETPKKTMKKYVAKAQSFLVTDKSFFVNIVKDILNRAFHFVGLGDMSAGKVEEVSSSKPFQLKCSHQYHTQVHQAMFVSKKNTPTYMFFFPKRVFVREWQRNNYNWLF